MLKQKQANLINELYLIIRIEKGLTVAESFLLFILKEDVLTCPRLTRYFSSYLQDEDNINQNLKGKTDREWLESVRIFVMDKLIKRYEEVLTWQVI